MESRVQRGGGERSGDTRAEQREQPNQQRSAALRPISLEEEIALEAYREGVKAALSAADSAYEKVLTASFSIATAYGALLALVKRDKTAARILLGAPFVLLAAAALAAAWGLVKGVKSLEKPEVTAVRGSVDDALDAKRKWTKGAVVLLVIALATSGCVVLSSYGAGAVTPAASPSPT